MRHFFLARGLRIVAMIALVVAGVGLAVMGLWNWLMPALFNWRAITYPEAVGLLVLGRILFGGFRGWPGRGRYWRERMAERWEKMTPEEREKFRQGMGWRCGRGAPPATD
jgi:hypothetical protein